MCVELVPKEGLTVIYTVCIIGGVLAGLLKKLTSPRKTFFEKNRKNGNPRS